VPDETRESRFLEIGALNRLAHLRFGTKHVVEGTYSGRHRSRHKGGAAEFLEHRQYTPGEDLRRLDWKVLGRTGRSYIRVYEDETDLTATVVMDVSRSMLFGARSRRDTTGSKLDYARYLCAALAHIIIKERDRFGLALASTQIDAFLPPAATVRQLNGVLSIIEEPDLVEGTSLAEGLSDLYSRLRHRGVLIVMSDFLDRDLERLFGAIRLFRHRHFGVLMVHLVHPLEERLPRGPAYRFEGLEGEPHRICSTHDIADAYERRFGNFMRGLRTLAISSGCSYHRFSTAVPYVHQLRSLLVERTG